MTFTSAPVALKSAYAFMRLIGFGMATLALQSVHGLEVSVDTAHEIGEMPLLGYNITYARNGQLIVDDSGTLQPGRLESLQAISPRWLRFPGGTISNTYDWKRAIGPQEQREDQVHAFLNRLDPEPSTFGPDEAARFMKTVDGSLVIVIAWNSTAADAADLVEYMNAEVGENPSGGIDWAAVRAANGHPEPYGVRYWEIGNEGGGRDIALWTSWPYDGDDIKNDGVRQGTEEARQWWADGGTKSFTNQLAGLRSTWNAAGVKARGRANEVFYAKFPPVVPGSLTLRVGINLETAQQWTLVADLGSSGAGDLHYTFDELTGRIEFGDGTHGALLPRLSYVYLDYTTGPRDGMRQFYNAMKAVDPTIRIGAGNFNLKQSRQADSTIPYDGWQDHGGFFLYNTDPVNADPYWELVARGIGTMPDESDKEWAGLAAFGNVKLYKTEYTSLGNVSTGGIQYSHTIAGALHHALFIRETALSQNAAVMGTNYLYNNLQSEVVHVDDNNIVSAQGWAYGMYNRHFGDTLVAASVGTGDELTLPFSVKGGGTRQVTFPVVLPLASCSADGRIHLMLINTSKETNYPVSANFGVPVLLPELHILDADSLTAVNSASVPDAVSIRSGPAPALVDSTTVAFEVPPASVSVVVVYPDNFSDSNYSALFPDAVFNAPAWSTWWGELWPIDPHWAYVLEEGYVYFPAGLSTGQGWVYDSKTGWTFLSSTLLPFVYLHDQGWLYRQPGSNSPNRFYYSYNLERWLSEHELL